MSLHIVSTIKTTTTCPYSRTIPDWSLFTWDRFIVIRWFEPAVIELNSLVSASIIYWWNMICQREENSKIITSFELFFFQILLQNCHLFWIGTMQTDISPTDVVSITEVVEDFRHRRIVVNSLVRIPMNPPHF